jgi:hypothetical protein
MQKITIFCVESAIFLVRKKISPENGLELSGVVTTKGTGYTGSHSLNEDSLRRFTVKFFVGIDWFDYWVFGIDYQTLWQRVTIQYQWSDYHTWPHHLIISDSVMWKRLQNVYSQIKQSWLNPLSQFIWQPPLSESSVKTPLSSQVGNLLFIPVFNVLSRVLSMVLFLRSWYFQGEVKIHSIPRPDPGWPWNCFHILTTSGYVRFTWPSPGTWSF